MKKQIFEGCATALITPFKKGNVDFDALGGLVERQINAGVAAIVVLGTTGEPCTLSGAEREQIIKFVKDCIRGRVKMIVGTGSNNTAEAIANSVAAKELGADALLVVTPYYNKCTQKGIVAYYNQIADAVEMPIIAYNVPGRTGVNILPEAAIEISRNPHIVGLKEASENIAHITALAHALRGRMALYSGDDEVNYLYLALGAAGIISVASNVIPEKLVAQFQAYKGGDIGEALRLHDEMYEFASSLFCEVNPIPVKAACHHLGLCSDEMRAPLSVIEEHNRRRVVSALEKIVGKG